MFTSTPILRDLERLMQQIPNFAPRGYGVMVLCEHENTAEDCDCAYCLYHTGRGKNIGCKLERCVCIRERIQAGAATQREVLTETLSSISYPPFQRRLEQHLKEREERPMEFKDTKHCLIFSEAIQKRDKINYALMSALYLITADMKLWNVARRYMEGNSIHFSKIKLCGIHPDGYVLFCGAKDLYLGTKHLSICDLSDPELITPKMFALICNAMAIRRFGLGAINYRKDESEENA